MAGNQEALATGFGKGFAVDFVGGIGGVVPVFAPLVLLPKGDRVLELSPSIRSKKSAFPSNVVPNQSTGPVNCFSQ
jgi:hypothetical protein